MKSTIKILLPVLSIIFTSCLTDEDIPIINYDLEDTAKLIRYAENLGDFPNSPDAPGLILASELYTNISNYWILDIRSEEEFSQGHIFSALNVRPENLVVVADSLNSIVPLKRIVLISKNGQSSAYYTCILRLKGFDNLFTLNFGMASWNTDFADEWLGIIGTSGLISSFVNNDFPKNSFTNLPINTYPTELKSIEEKVNFRLNKLLIEGFTESDIFYKSLGSTTIQSNYIVCYGNGRLYFAPRDVPLAELGHPENSVWFRTEPNYEFRSSQFLQTLPTDKSIIIYSGNGQLSASITAYLRFLGYDAKTLLFGANQLFYPRMLVFPELEEDIFSQEDIMNYPYITGN